MGVLLAGSSLKKGWGNHFSKFSGDIYYSITGCLDCLAYCGGVQMNNAIQDADLWFNDLIDHVFDKRQKPDWKGSLYDVITAALKSSPVDVDIDDIANAINNGSPYGKSIVRQTIDHLAEKGHLNTISATSRKRSEVTEEDAREALNHFFDSNPPPKHIEETIRKCLQAFAGGK